MAAMSSVADSGLQFERGASITELYPRLLQRVIDRGSPVAPRGRSTRELSPFLFVLEDPRQSLVLQRARRLNRAYAIVEKLALAAGIQDPAMSCFYVDRLREYVNPCTGKFDGAYGPRVAPQLHHVYRLLRQDPESRRAVVSIFGEADQHESEDVPCTVSLQFLLRDRELNLIVNMRSSDVYLGIPYDVNQFCFLQLLMAEWLGVQPGSYVHFAASAHVYEAEIERAARVIDAADDLRAFEEPPIRFPYDETAAEFRTFFALEQQIREGNIRDPGEVPQLSAKPWLRFWVKELVDFAQKRAARKIPGA